MRNQKGFTLIELVVVIVILGILAAIAVPKFIDMQVSARQSTLSGMLAAVQSASALAHAQSLINGNAAANVTMEGAPVTMSNSYPTADAAGIAESVTTDGFFFEAAAGGNPAYFNFGGAADADCRVSYTAAAAGGVPTIEIAAGEGACAN